MVRSFFAVLGGMILWALLWITTNSLVLAVAPGRFQDGVSDDPLVLAASATYATLFGVLAGFFTAGVARRRMLAHAAVLGALQLAIGIGVQASFWDRMPVWYHLVFLVLQFPSYVLGGWLRARRAAG